MLYVSIKDEEKNSYKRNAVVNELLLESGLEEAENIKLDFTEDGKKLKLFEVSAEEASKSDFLIVNRIGLYKGVKTDIDVLFLDEETMLVSVNSGCVFLRSENVPNKAPTFAVTRDADAIERGEVDMVAMLDTTGSVKTVNSKFVHWVSTKDIYSLIKSVKSDSFGLHSNVFTMDYYYSLSVISSADWNKDRTYLSTGYKVSCLESVDLSYGLVEDYEQKAEERRKRAEQRAWDLEMDRQRKLLEMAKNQVYYEDEEDDDYLYELMEDEEFE